MAKSPGRAVHPTILLRMFKEVGYESLIMEKIAVAGRPYKSDPVGTGHHQPIGTKSETVPYLLNGVIIALCHQYTLPDGSLGASGKPDPKAIQYMNQKLLCHSKVRGEPHNCPICLGPPEDWQDVMNELLGIILKP